MNRLQQICAGLILTFALSASAFAGQVNCPGITGEMPTVGVTEMILLILALV